MISSAVWIQYTNVTDEQTDGHRATAKNALTHRVARKKYTKNINRPMSIGLRFSAKNK